MIRHRHVFVVRHQRAVGPVDQARGMGVMDAGEEVREVADLHRQMQLTGAGQM